MPNSLRSALNALAADFANGVLVAIRSASLQDLIAEGGGSPRARRSVRPDDGGGQIPIPSRTARKSGRLARRSAADIDAELTKVVAAVKTRKAGLRAEEIKAMLGLQSKELPRVLKQGLATKQLRSEGQKRATTYFAGRGRHAKTAPARKAAAKHARRASKKK